MVSATKSPMIKLACEGFFEKILEQWRIRISKCVPFLVLGGVYIWIHCS